MKISKTLAFLLALLILNATLSANFILKTSQDDQKLSNYVCKITKDIIKSKNDTQDVFIGNFGGKLWSSAVNDIAGCIGYDNAVVINDFKSLMTEKTLRKAAVSIVTFEEINKRNFRRITSQMFSSVWHHMTKVLFLISGSTDAKSISLMISDLFFFGYQNFALVSDRDNFISVLTYGAFDGLIRNLDENATKQEIFPDTLINLLGYSYRVAVCNQYPRIVIENGEVQSSLLFFLNAVAKIQNATIGILRLQSCNWLSKYWEQKLMDLTLNTAVEFYAPSIPKLLTYEESGHCALVPMPPKVPLFQSIFIEPFDGLTWLFFVLTMACCVAVWWLFRNLGAVDSPWLLAYGIFVMFIGQGVDFSRTNRFVLAILLQLIIVMIWILNQAYEGVITSFMIQPIQENRLETFDDLLASDYEIITDPAFRYSVHETAAFERLKSRMEVNVYEKWGSLRIRMQKLQKVVILECDQIELIMTFQFPNDNNVSDHYYMLPQKLTSYLIRLEASYLNPFIERLQFYMDLSFQAGLMQIWKVFMSNKNLRTRLLWHNNDPSYLKFEDLAQVFSILIIGYILSLIVLSMEFLHNKIVLKYMNRRNKVHQIAKRKKKQPKHPKYQKGALYYIIHRRKKVKRLKARKSKVRRIFIQPRFPVD